MFVEEREGELEQTDAYLLCGSGPDMVQILEERTHQNIYTPVWRGASLSVHVYWVGLKREEERLFIIST